MRVWLARLWSRVCKYLVETDFLQLALQHLKKKNLVYQLCKCVGTMRSDGSDSLLPVKCMPTGLIDLQCTNCNKGISDAGIFFYQQVMCPTDYSSPCMLSLAQSGLNCMGAGPMWCIDSTGQDGTDGENRNFIPAAVLPNHYSHSGL